MQLCTEVHVQNIKILRLYYHIRQHKPNNTHIHSFIHPSTRTHTHTHTHTIHTQHTAQNTTQHTESNGPPHTRPHHNVFRDIRFTKSSTPWRDSSSPTSVRAATASSATGRPSCTTPSDTHTAVLGTHSQPRSLAHSHVVQRCTCACMCVALIVQDVFWGEDKGRNFLLFTRLNMYGTVLHEGVDNGNNNKYIYNHNNKTENKKEKRKTAAPIF